MEGFGQPETLMQCDIEAKQKHVNATKALH